MLKIKSEIFFLLLLVTLLQACSNPSDHTLDLIFIEHDVQPLDSQPFEKSDRYLLGQALFFDPILSGNRDVSCATCHLLRRGTSDALPTSIGVDGEGVGEKRKLVSGDLEHPRNSLDLWNRDNKSVKNLFWDGEVEVLDSKKRIFRSLLNKQLPEGMENALAIQALFPLVSPNEMLGHSGDKSRSDLPEPHASLPNELAGITKNLKGAQRMTAVHELIMKRLIGDGDKQTYWQTEYRKLFEAGVQGKSLESITIADVGNVIAHFEELAFATRDAAWDQYVRGDIDAISEKAKQGAMLFYGKARCAQCHNGQIFSDFNFHALGVENNGPGVEQTGIDKGRFRVTKDLDDMYKFRTPPLRNVSLTPPYFHNGIMKNLKDTIEFHLVDKDVRNGVLVSKLLPRKADLNKDDINAIIEFLFTLEDDQIKNMKNIIPERVPSGLPIISAPASLGQ